MNKSLLIASTVAAFLFASCDNENTTNPEPTATVTIKGAVYSDIDENDEDDITFEKVPAGVALYFKSDDGALLATGTTTADGFSQELTINKAQIITVYVADFEVNVNKYDGLDDNGDPAYVSKPAYYNSGENFGQYAQVSVQKGGTYIANIQIDQPTVKDF